MKEQNELHLTVGVNDPLSPGKALLLGLQHVLAMDLYIAPIVLAGILSMTVTETAFFIQMTFIAAGIATLIQTGFGIRLPVMQGPSYVPIGALAAIGSSMGLPVVFGSLFSGALFITVLGWPLKALGSIVRKIIPPLVGGTVIVVVGIALMPVALNGVYHAPGDMVGNCVIALVAGSMLVALMVLGTRLPGAGSVLRLTSVILSMACGTAVAAMYGVVDFSPVAKADWLALPRFFPFGMPQFDLASSLTLIFIYFVVLVETTGTWFAVGAVTGEELTDKRLNGGAVGEGIGCFIGALFGGTPVTGYSTNAGIIAVTGVASRWAIMGGGVVLMVLGLMPKLMNVIACIPGVVISGVFAVICVIISMNGFRVVKGVKLDERNMLVIGLPVLLTLAAVLMPRELVDRLPELARYLVASGIAVGALSAVILNLILPESRD
ncbi:NCS2 family nucleobase:cation symporter-2 [Desulfobaculum xiamenense]|uniref:NCS2 family nucleobase:cation symporter-2 n=1 Tax=Desulfobaculum xiamenense TaxID=995050 RepID=A0A846QQT8_9BACT|nr:nucleobase:cation symporter-2 family protein [Desulfobaculum xiamenense]NJB69350.1 NCS2 family nucleobase:cation symporter-2 [Desulfobaculum xiamenense]